MNPVETLMGEHRIIERTLDALVAWATGMVNRDADERTELDRFVTFVRDFVDPVHHGKEEDILFVTLVEHGFSREQGPIAVMLHEHEECRAFIQALAAMAHQANPWTEGERRQVARAAFGYAELLRQHIHKEDQILFPMSEARLPEAAKAKIAAGFARFETEKANPAERSRLLGLAESFVSRHAPGGGAR